MKFVWMVIGLVLLLGGMAFHARRTGRKPHLGVLLALTAVVIFLGLLLGDAISRP